MPQKRTGSNATAKEPGIGANVIFTANRSGAGATANSTSGEGSGLSQLAPTLTLEQNA